MAVEETSDHKKQGDLGKPDENVEEAKDGGNSVDAAEKVLTIFRSFDVNGDGFIDRHELQNVLVELDPSMWTDRRLGRLLNALDRNRDGKIHYHEFVQWVCSPDSCRDLQAFRSALHVTQEEGKCAPRHLPKRTSSTSTSTDATSNASIPVPRRSSLQRRPSKQPKGDGNSPSAKDNGDLAIPKAQRRKSSKCVVPEIEATNCSDNVDEDRSDPSQRLIIFDYDGTISVDKDERFKGFRGNRLQRLQAMVKKIRASQVRCILVTAQFPATTRESTIPALQKTGVCGLFENEALECRLGLYWDDEEHGTVYNGSKVMLGKIDLIKEIINGKNCWQQCFEPANVLFIDDDARNFKGNESVGIQTRLLAQDGMMDEDMDLIENFAERGTLRVAFAA